MTNIHCCVSTRCSFFNSRRYNNAYVCPSESSKDSILAFGCLSTFLIKASSSEVIKSVRWYPLQVSIVSYTSRCSVRFAHIHPMAPVSRESCLSFHRETSWRRARATSRRLAMASSTSKVKQQGHRERCHLSYALDARITWPRAANFRVPSIWCSYPSLCFDVLWDVVQVGVELM